ncbi:Hypothetical protein ORPV_481 [Orpheovirus IHUMI-LCC2]|uniref:Uncharacterized protein n=1 Tax=Orpheovirus IHUMI-LCC2 TaxID=2023057 RepID=A0A2I2L4A7_9VIRU|nr:Hypothetical protein ORPV_481 [Orpheovirus IHUMI-LCC2]SNW62385.1 Hypothetical protein ORPV_481 [Orpheovirus IHUMI-LCC2]
MNAVKLFQDIDPTNTYLQFVKNFLGTKDSSSVGNRNLLYVHGNGNNGRSTLFTNIRNAFENEVWTYDTNKISLKDVEKFLQVHNTKLLRFCDYNDFRGEYVLELEKIANKYPDVGFIVESNVAVPEGFSGLVLKCVNSFTNTRQLVTVDRESMLQLVK